MLSEQDKLILDLSARRAPADVILEQTGLSQTRYLQRLAKLCGAREALEYSPVLVNRLNRLADGYSQRRRARHGDD